ncbi:MAG: hypothetical protein IPN67_06850 [Bacteroidales bacterium]|nr:hypothetical protein [Bacteroidales bacterium]
MRLLLPLIISVFYLSTISGNQIEIPYSVPAKPWPESFGNHRAVLHISNPSEVVTLDILWRRHDPDPDTRRFLIINASSGDTISNIFRYKVNNEECRIAFGPVKMAGTYYFYYLPYDIQEEWGFYGKDYLKRESDPSGEWLLKNHVNRPSRSKSFVAASITDFQSRFAFDSFYPMEVIALLSEKSVLLEKYTNDWLVFPEDRSYPIRMRDEIPLRWIRQGPSEQFTGEALKNEYYAFQIGVYASKAGLQNLKVEFTSLQGASVKIPASSLTCFNTGGIGPYGKPFEKRVDVGLGMVQPLWIGIDIPEAIPAGTYTGSVIIKPENARPQTIKISLKIADKIIADRGDSEPWRHSRLRWLNSTLGIDDKTVKPYKPIEFLGNNTYRLTEKILRMDDGGMPGSINVSGTELLSDPISFVVESGKGFEKFTLPEDISLIKNKPGAIGGSWRCHSDGFELTGTGMVEADGYINYKIKIRALRDISLKDVRLEIPFAGNVAQYIIGMGLPGTVVPEAHQAPWSGPFDSFWMGNTYAGLWCELRGGSYNGPLLNLYNPAPPASWYNNDNGGFRITKNQSGTNAVVYSGARELKSGEKLDFEWSMLITPVKKINTGSQFTDRYYHNGGNPMPSDADLSCGVKIVNLHHANNYNPHINYPFIATDSMRWFVDKMHSKGQKVKIYYTIRELTNYTTEIWALRSLGDEILGNGDGGGYTWLREHFISGYRPQWYQHFPDKSPDASIVNAPGDSRWYNYYIEGLAWLVRNVDIDGLYLDDVTYDRRTVKRIRKVLDNEKPGCILELHSNTGFSKGPANQYAEYFPYIDKIWFGESFLYDKMSPGNWLVETSGIPFGLMGDMLQGGGNRWRGMVYGMTVRHPWTTEGVLCDPRPVWKIWDEFGIESSVMKGYWQNDCPVKTDRPDVKATIYLKNGESLLSVASWAEDPVKFLLKFDWKVLGIDPSKAELYAPSVENFQEERSFRPDETIPVEPGKGWMIIVKEKK